VPVEPDSPEFAAGHPAAIATANAGLICLAKPMNAVADSQDVIVQALSELRDAARTNLERTKEILGRLDEHEKSLLAGGGSASAAVQAEHAPRIVEMLSQNMAALETSGAEFRAAQAPMLRDEGLTMDAITALFGVSRSGDYDLLGAEAVAIVETASPRLGIEVA
jgi:hypothetical protein